MVFWRLSLLFSTFALPQLLGVLLYFRLVRFSRWLAFALGLLAPAVLFFFLAPAYFVAGMREIDGGQPSCGMPAVAAAFMILSGTVAQLIVGLVVQLRLLRRRRS